MERLRQVLLGETSGEGTDVVVHSRGGVVVVDNGFSVGVEVKEVDAVDIVGGSAEHL